MGLTLEVYAVQSRSGKSPDLLLPQVTVSVIASGQTPPLQARPGVREAPPFERLRAVSEVGLPKA